MTDHKAPAEAANEPTRWSDVTIADLIFFDRLMTAISTLQPKTMQEAALAAGLTGAHCSTTLSKLESLSRFGKTLLDRKSLMLTHEGKAVLDYARRVLKEYKVRPFHTSRVTLRIALTNRILTTLLAAYLPHFIERYRSEAKTDIDIEMLESTSEQVLSWVETGEVELAFGAIRVSKHHSPTIDGDSTRNHPKLTMESLREDLRTVVVAPPKGMGIFSVKNKRDGMKVSMKNLGTTNLCLIRRDLRGDFSDLPDPEPGYTRIVVDNYSSVLAMVRSRAAVGILIDRGIPSDFLKFEFADAHLSVQNFAVWHRKGTDLSPAALALKKEVGVEKRRRKK